MLPTEGSVLTALLVLPTFVSAVRRVSEPPLARRHRSHVIQANEQTLRESQGALPISEKPVQGSASKEQPSVLEDLFNNASTEFVLRAAGLAEMKLVEWLGDIAQIGAGSEIGDLTRKVGLVIAYSTHAHSYRRRKLREAGD